MTAFPTRTTDGTLRVADAADRLAWATYSAAGDRVSGVNRDAVVSVTRGDEGLFAVADGMGHLKGSENASRIAADRLTALFSRGLGEARTFMDRLSETARTVCAAIREKIELEDGDRSMGTTLTGCAVFGSDYTVFHIGDSRLYHYSSGRVIRRTEDHTRQAEAERTGIRVPEGLPPHQLTRALMYADEKTTSVAFYPSDGGTFPLSSGDILVACTDGIHKHLTDSDFALALEGVSDSVSLGKALEKLALRALANGSTDDRSLTGVYVAGGRGAVVGGAGTRSQNSLGRVPTTLLWVALVVAALAVGVLTYLLTRKPVEVIPAPTPTVEASPTPSETASPSPSPDPSPTADPNSETNSGDDVPPVIGDPTTQPSPTPTPKRDSRTTIEEPKKPVKPKASGNSSGIRIPEINKTSIRRIRDKIKRRLPKGMSVEIDIPKPIRTEGSKATPKPDRPKSTPKPSSGDDDPRRPKDRGTTRPDSGKTERADDDPRRPRR